MCRNIRVLHNFEPAATPEEIEAAAVQYVRKISGASKPSKANEAAFELAVAEVTATSKRLLASLVTNAPPPASRSLLPCLREEYFWAAQRPPLGVFAR